MPTVVAKIVGGIGNQLFCYAAARRLALQRNADLCLELNFFRSDVNFGRACRLDRFKLPAHTVRRSRRRLPPRLDHYLWRLQRRAALAGLLPGSDWLIESAPGVFEPRVLEAQVARTTVLDGYWQDERYFADVAPRLRQDLEFRGELDARRRELAPRIIGGESVAVHCRRLYGERDALGFDYYERAIAAIAAGVTRPAFFLFGDDPRWLQERWPKGLAATVVGNGGGESEVADLRLMSLCRHFIVANSTFSWWGAWLGAAPGKVVVAPRPQGRRFEVRSAAGWTEI